MWDSRHRLSGRAKLDSKPRESTDTYGPEGQPKERLSPHARCTGPRPPENKKGTRGIVACPAFCQINSEA